MINNKPAVISRGFIALPGYSANIDPMGYSEQPAECASPLKVSHFINSMRNAKVNLSGRKASLACATKVSPGDSDEEDSILAVHISAGINIDARPDLDLAGSELSRFTELAEQCGPERPDRAKQWYQLEPVGRVRLQLFLNATERSIHHLGRSDHEEEEAQEAQEE
jgi:hypothetical protein